MARGNFPRCNAITLSHEGGWADHPSDPGGATMKGVTLATYRKRFPNATKTDLRKISDSDLEAIYREDYWNPIRAEDLPFGVDLATYDFGVNSGPSRAVRNLQAVLAVPQDGIVGPATLMAAAASDGKAAIKSLCGRRLSFVRGLRTWAVFGGGWSRRIADIEARAVAMWLARGGTLQHSARNDMKAEAAKAGKAATAQNGSAGGAAAGGGAAVTGDINWWIIAGIAVVVALVVAGLVIRARHNRERAKAYERIAAAG